MTGAVKTPRTKRGRLLIVNTLEFAGQLPETLQARIDKVNNLYEAIGAIATCSVTNPIEAVVVHANRLTRPLEVVVESIRRLDPTVLLYLVVDSENDPQVETAVDKGFDGMLVAPLSAYMISAILGDQTNGSEENISQERVAEIEITEPVAVPTPEVTEEKQPVVEVEAIVETSNERLGDSDLVDIAMSAPEKLAETAMKLLIQETGWKSAKFIPSVDKPEGSDCAVPVVYRENKLGWLVSDNNIDPKAMLPWADWLAGWARLGETRIELNQMAYHDPLTGAYNRRYFEEFLPTALDNARRDRRLVNLLVFDVDDLKKYNDQFGHEAGDDVLREAVRLMQSTVRQGDKVCRVGGDEFVVVFSDNEPPRKPGSVPIKSIESVVIRFQEAICEMKFNKLSADAPGNLSISAGLATFPWDGTDARGLLRTADRLAMESKRKGKNTLTIGPGAEAICEMKESEKTT